MANAESKKLTVDVIARIDKLEKGMAKAAAVSNKQFGAIEARARKMDGVLKNIGAGFAAGLSTATLERFARGIVDATNDVAELYRQAKQTGTSFKDLQTLGYAFEKNQVPVDEFAGAMRELQDKADEFASTGGGRAAEALQTLGFTSATTATALQDPAEMLRTIIDRLGELDRASQIRLSGDLFGNAAGDKFLRMLDLGKSGIQALEDQAVSTGFVIADATGARADELDRKFNDIRMKWDNWWKQVVVEVGGKLAQWNNIPQLGMIPIFGDPKKLLGGRVDDTGAGASWDELRGMLPSQRSGVTRDPGRGADWAELVDMLGSDASAKLESAATGIERIGEATDETSVELTEMSDAWRDAESAAKSFASQFVSDLFAGKSAVESLGGALDDLGQRLVQMALDASISQLFANLAGAGMPIPTGGSMGNGLWGSAIFQKRERGGPVNAGQPYVVGERRAEVFVPDQPGRILPSVGGLRGMAASGGGNVSVNMPITVDATGADAAGLARVESQVARLRAELPSKVIATVRDARKRRAL